MAPYACWARCSRCPISSTAAWTHSSKRVSTCCSTSPMRRVQQGFEVGDALLESLEALVVLSGERTRREQGHEGQGKDLSSLSSSGPSSRFRRDRPLYGVRADCARLPRRRWPRPASVVRMAKPDRFPPWKSVVIPRTICSCAIRSGRSPCVSDPRSPLCALEAGFCPPFRSSRRPWRRPFPASAMGPARSRLRKIDEKTPQAAPRPRPARAPVARDPRDRRGHARSRTISTSRTTSSISISTTAIEPSRARSRSRPTSLVNGLSERRARPGQHPDRVSSVTAVRHSPRVHSTRTPSWTSRSTVRTTSASRSRSSIELRREPADRRARRVRLEQVLRIQPRI